MNCRSCQKIIYLYNEAAECERKQVQAHVSSCSVCKKIYQEAVLQRNLLKKFLPSVQSEGNDPLLTNRILKKIIHAKESEISVLDRLVDFLHSVPVRYALAAVSFFLISFFFMESLQSTEHHPVVADQPSSYHRMIFQPNASELRLTDPQLKQTIEEGDYIKAATELFSKQQKSLSFYECFQICFTNQNEDKCSQCKTKYAKLRYYEEN